MNLRILLLALTFYALLILALTWAIVDYARTTRTDDRPCPFCTQDDRRELLENCAHRATAETTAMREYQD